MPITNQSQWTKARLRPSEEGGTSPETYDVSQSAQSLPSTIQRLVKEMTASLSQIRDSRIQALRDQIRAGSYQVDNTVLAKEMLNLSHLAVVGGNE
jgi:flagellar biosynthesis anti-sigma factor FlgM